MTAHPQSPLALLTRSVDARPRKNSGAQPDSPGYTGEKAKENQRLQKGSVRPGRLLATTPPANLRTRKVFQLLAEYHMLWEADTVDTKTVRDSSHLN